jgi:glycosyltransferase involved in cell wall biosynthesis
LWYRALAPAPTLEEQRRSILRYDRYAPRNSLVVFCQFAVPAGIHFRDCGDELGVDAEAVALNETYSVVVPAYNAEKTIDASLASVLEQSLPPLQVLIIDDCSEDGTELAVGRWEGRFARAGIEFTYIRLACNGGPSIARNMGIRNAEGSYVAFLDADDVWASDKLMIVDQMMATSKAGLVCHAYTEAGEFPRDNAVIDFHARNLSLHSMLVRNPAQTSCAVVRRQLGLAFDEAMRYCEDHDLWLRIAESLPVLWLDGPALTRLGRPQLSAGGLSGSTARMRFGQLRVYYNFCRRKWGRRGWLLPALLFWSLLKHISSPIRRWLR